MYSNYKIFTTKLIFRGQHTKNALPNAADLLQLRYKFPKEELGHGFQLKLDDV